MFAKKRIAAARPRAIFRVFDRHFCTFLCSLSIVKFSSERTKGDHVLKVKVGTWRMGNQGIDKSQGTAVNRHNRSRDLCQTWHIKAIHVLMARQRKG